MTTFKDLMGASRGFRGKVKRTRAGRKADPMNPDRTIVDWESLDELVMDGFIASSSSSETPDGAREQAVSTAVLTAPDAFADIRRGDIVERIPADGRKWRVTGFPSFDASPFTGWAPSTEAMLEEVVG